MKNYIVTLKETIICKYIVESENEQEIEEKILGDNWRHFPDSSKIEEEILKIEEFKEEKKL